MTISDTELGSSAGTSGRAYRGAGRRRSWRPSARQAVRIGARVLWLQMGIESAEAKRIGEEAGLVVVMDRCMAGTHAELGLGAQPGRQVAR